MTSTTRNWLKVAVATLGAGALTLGGAVLPAAAADSAGEPVEFNAAASKYERASVFSGTPAAEIEQQEATDKIHVSDRGFVYFKDQAQDALAGHDHAHGDHAASGAPIPGNPAEGSRPGAPVTVYLDFDGELLEGKHWNTDSGIASLDFASATVNSQEEIWAAVAEDYAPFNVNVTTTRPSDDDLYKTSADDQRYGAHVIITDSYDDVLPAAAGSGGIAWLGGAGSEYLSGALVFTQGTEGDSKIIAEIASHESGHNFGLEHDGYADEEYYVPQDGLWGPIMGAGYYVPVTHWSNGGYANSSNSEDDLSVITDRSAGGARLAGIYLPNGDPYTGDYVCTNGGDVNNPQPGDVWNATDDAGNCTDVVLTLEFTFVDRADHAADTVGNGTDTAAALDNSSGSFGAQNVILGGGDVDVYSFSTIGGAISAQVDVADFSPNLDSRLTLLDGSGAVVTDNDPIAERVAFNQASGLDSSITATVDAGTYFLVVEGVGVGDPTTATSNNANGYTNYGSLGNYTLTGTADPLATAPIVITSPVDGSDVVGGADVEVVGTATPGATVTVTVGGTVVATVTADATGAWTATVTANQYGETVITASQSIDSIAIPGTATVTVVAPAAPLAPPVINTPTDGATTDSANPTIAGTGTPGAVVTVTVTDASGQEFTGQATVDANGTWWLDLSTALPNGEYSVVAVQSLDGVTSDDSNVVNFSIVLTDDNNTGGNNGGGKGDDDLATTGSDFNAAPFAAMAALLLVIGGGVAVFARRKSVSADS